MAMTNNPILKAALQKLQGGDAASFDKGNVDPKLEALGKRFMGSKWAGLKDRFAAARKRRGLK